MNRIDLKSILRNRELDFQDRVVLNFIRELGYKDQWIVKEPQCGRGRADYLVETPVGQFFIEAHSPDLSKKSLMDLETRDRATRFEELLSRRVQRTLPKIFERCCLMVNYGTGSSGPTLTRDVEGPEVNSILNKLCQWIERIDKLPEYTSEKSRAYRWWESCPESTLKQLKITIPYPFGTLIIASGKGDYTIGWKLLKRHYKYGPGEWMCLSSGGGGDATPCNAARGFKKKIEQHRRRVMDHPEVKDIPLVLFLDGRSDLHFGSGGDYSDLNRFFADEIRWGSTIPHAVVLIGAWGLPVNTAASKEVEEQTGDMIFNQRDPSVSKPHLLCLNPFIQRRDVIRLWTVHRNIGLID